MLIEVNGPQEILEQILLLFQDQLTKASYSEGPRVGSMDSGTWTTYVKGNLIVTLQLSQESETDETTLRIEAEQEIPELHTLWNTALIQYSKKIKETLIQFATDKEFVKREIN
jgi:hypothetical protein